ncbi:uncharacterized protein CLUP02_10397 [Colletotrichum lupini]|uniref:Uncharacterized protein n=1 Tax=Colletotrichum lupini TaxID=145971 RepID=A0A9Q8SWM1_9PEZI|nr:uncharacterized protein CLUP02_10397 [Colletotrichum lupini]UQC84901.1 hypothetical protein CLUP02_10397 [Colletotrichum lupini]
MVSNMQDAGGRPPIRDVAQDVLLLKVLSFVAAPEEKGETALSHARQVLLALLECPLWWKLPDVVEKELRIMARGSQVPQCSSMARANHDDSTLPASPGQYSSIRLLRNSGRHRPTTQQTNSARLRLATEIPRAGGVHTYNLVSQAIETNQYAAYARIAPDIPQTAMPPLSSAKIRILSVDNRQPCLGDTALESVGLQPRLESRPAAFACLTYRLVRAAESQPSASSGVPADLSSPGWVCQGNLDLGPDSLSASFQMI